MKRIGITMGDPAGVGPELLLSAMDELANDGELELLAFAAPEILREVSRKLGRPLPAAIINASRIAPGHIQPGSYSSQAGQAQFECLEAGTAALARGDIDALVTGPLHKRCLRQAGQTGPGQTEWLHHRLGAAQVVMMLAAPVLKVALLTTHLPIREVATRIDRPLVESVLRLCDRELRRFFHPAGARMALCALNPHGEEEGQPGREESEILEPAAEALRSEGLDLSGPLSADSLMPQAAAGRYDLVVAAYHDQGLAPIKLLCPRQAVNITLGLGHIRTSPDHGPAYELAWQGRASPESLLAAIRQAHRMTLAPEAHR